MAESVRKVYFAHPMRTYGTKDEARIVGLLRESGLVVVNPSDYSKEAVRLTALAGGGWLSCEVCREKVMEVLFYRLLGECAGVAYWNPFGTCGVRCEVARCRSLSKPVYDVGIYLENRGPCRINVLLSTFVRSVRER